MSLRMFTIFCALVGGLCAYLGWGLGLNVTQEGIKRTALKGAIVGLTLSFGLSVLDSLWNTRTKGQSVLHALMATLFGGAGGFLGGFLGELLYKFHFLFLPLGWAITGLFIGVSMMALDLFLALGDSAKTPATLKKLTQCLVGGGVGGILGGFLFALAGFLTEKVFGKGLFWTPAALGFSALGISIGFFIGLAQVLLKEAWIKVENGRWKGKEILLFLNQTIIGRKEGCQLGLFGDPNVMPSHAAIEKTKEGYFIQDIGSRDGTFVNKKRISGPAKLQNGDLIQLGGTKIRFLEVEKK